VGRTAVAVCVTGFGAGGTTGGVDCGAVVAVCGIGFGTEGTTAGGVLKGF
jgi:hypothetical protein